MKKFDVSSLLPKDAAARKQWMRENYKRVSVVPKFNLSGVSDQDTLRRYVDLPRLFDLIKNKCLVMPTLGELIRGDPFECTATMNLEDILRDDLIRWAVDLQEYAPPSARRTKHVQPPQLLPFLSSWGEEDSIEPDLRELTDEELRETVWYLERERLKRNLVCSCWHSAAMESDAMWKIYASQLGVSINSSIAKMKAAIKMIVPKIYSASAELDIAAVHYEDSEYSKGTKPWLIKRKAFSHEREVRLFCDVPFFYGEKFELEVELSTLIEEIVITPFAPTWQAAGIQAAIEAFVRDVGAGSILVRQSKHMRAPNIPWPPDKKDRNEDSYNVVRQPLIGDLA